MGAAGCIVFSRPPSDKAQLQQKCAAAAAPRDKKLPRGGCAFCASAARLAADEPPPTGSQKNPGRRGAGRSSPPRACTGKRSKPRRPGIIAYRSAVPRSISDRRPIDRRIKPDGDSAAARLGRAYDDRRRDARPPRVYKSPRRGEERRSRVGCI